MVSIHYTTSSDYCSFHTTQLSVVTDMCVCVWYKTKSSHYNVQKDLKPNRPPYFTRNLKKIYIFKCFGHSHVLDNTTQLTTHLL